ncbi:NADP-dependent oxidoreductase domain-containing protein [Lanmaoa asiatica]|nr:NADP-dependent oxidoreductase domain-containing protein [Lanmaoa asiatica]
MKALHDLIQSGKVRFIGASSMQCWQFAHVNEVASKNGSTKFEREMLAYRKFNGIGVIPWAPLAAGDLARPVGTESVRLSSSKGTIFEKKILEANKTIITRVEELANKKGVKMGQIALTWVGEEHRNGIVLTPEEATCLEAPYLPKPIRGHD